MLKTGSDMWKDYFDAERENRRGFRAAGASPRSARVLAAKLTARPLTPERAARLLLLAAWRVEVHTMLGRR